MEDRKLAKYVSSLNAEGAYRVLEAAQKLEAEGHDIVHLEIGQPGFPVRLVFCLPRACD